MALNAPSFRLPFDLTGKADPAVVEAVHLCFNGLLNHEQAFASLGKTAATTTSTPASTPSPTTTASTSSETIVQVAPSVGFVNNQVGVTTYVTAQADYGKLVVLNDASPIAVTLTTGTAITLPWYCRVSNIGTGAATLTPASGVVYSAAAPAGAATYTVAGGTGASVYYDGVNFYV